MNRRPASHAAKNPAIAATVITVASTERFRRSAVSGKAIDERPERLLAAAQSVPATEEQSNPT
jgi:hypothetical protein